MNESFFFDRDLLLPREIVVNVHGYVINFDSIQKIVCFAVGEHGRDWSGGCRDFSWGNYVCIRWGDSISGNWNKMDLEYFVKEIPCDISLSVVIISFMNTRADHREKNRSRQVYRGFFVDPLFSRIDSVYSVLFSGFKNCQLAKNISSNIGSFIATVLIIINSTFLSFPFVWVCSWNHDRC